MKIPDGIKEVVVIGLDGEDYVHLLSYVESSITRDLLLDALDILDNTDNALENLH